MKKGRAELGGGCFFGGGKGEPAFFLPLFAKKKEIALRDTRGPVFPPFFAFLVARRHKRVRNPNAGATSGPF
jgi:hypothetical protein